MKTQIPIYRAKKIDSDEYVDGYYVESYEQPKHGKVVPLEDRLKVSYLKSERSDKYYADYDFHQIDPSTLSIHFPNMIDSEGTKIFASLSEDGKGGDIGEHEYGAELVFLYDEGMFKIARCDDMRDYSSFNFTFFVNNDKIKATGIKK